VADWTFFTNHAHVLLCIARDPEIRVRDLAIRVGITERAAQRIVADLVDAGYVERSRDGRRNRYRVRDDLPLRHPVEQPHRVGEVLAVLAELEPALLPDAASRPPVDPGSV
jgi:DNA-binding transcriptional ArsR family regulator